MRTRSLIVVAVVLSGCLAAMDRESVSIDGAAASRLGITVRHRLLLTAVRIDGREVGPFVIDSGAGSLVLDPELARTVKLKVRGQVLVAETGRMVDFGAVPLLEVGPVAMRNAQAIVVDLSPVSRAMGERLAGVLGYPFFARTVVEVDYATRSVSCFDPARYRLPPRGTWQPLTVRNNQVGVPVRMDGEVEGTFLLDTGSTEVVHFYAEFMKRHRGLPIRHVGKNRQVRVSGEHETLEGRLAWFELGRHRFDNVSVTFRPPSDRRAEGVSFDGVVGEGLLREFVVVFNYPESKVAFLRR